jgi:uncharacterized OB-fold protein
MMVTDNYLMFHKCENCGARCDITAQICPICLSEHLILIEILGKGKLASWTTIRKPPLQFKDEASYVVGVFDLDAGIRVTGRFMYKLGDCIGDTVMLVDRNTNNTNLKKLSFEVIR